MWTIKQLTMHLELTQSVVWRQQLWWRFMWTWWYSHHSLLLIAIGISRSGSYHMDAQSQTTLEPSGLSSKFLPRVRLFGHMSAVSPILHAICRTTKPNLQGVSQPVDHQGYLTYLRLSLPHCQLTANRFVLIQSIFLAF